MLEIDLRTPGSYQQTRPRSQTQLDRLAAWLSFGLAAAAATACLVMLLDGAVLRGPAAMNGSARGTALTVLVVGIPLLLWSVGTARRGSSLARLTWLGALGTMTYNALMFLFATPFNPLFLLYVAWLALSVWSLGAVLTGLNVHDLAGRFAPTAPRRAVAAYISIVAALNALLWLRGVGPGLFEDGPPSFLDGTGLSTSIVYAQDLGLWLPLMVVVAVWLWRGQPWGLVLAAGGLVMWVVESISVAVDQAYGSAADPASSVVSARLTPWFAGLAVIGLVPILLLFNRFDGEGLLAKVERLAAPASRRTAWSWALTMVALTLAAAAFWGGITVARTGYDMPDSWLVGTPFTSWTVPGVALLVGVALPQAVLVTLTVGASHWARLAGIACGASLIAWIAIQLLVLQHVFFLQPIIAAFGLLEIWLVHRWQPDRGP